MGPACLTITPSDSLGGSPVAPSLCHLSHLSLSALKRPLRNTNARHRHAHEELLQAFRWQ